MRRCKEREMMGMGIRGGRGGKKSVRCSDERQGELKKKTKNGI